MEGKHIQLGGGVGWSRDRGIGDWKGGAVVYDKSVSPFPVPASRIDAQRWPRLHAVAERCPVTARAFDDDEEPDADVSGPRRLVVIWDRRSGGGTVEMRGGDEPAFGFVGSLPGRCRLVDERTTEEDDEDQYDDDDLLSMIPLDRLVRAVSDERIDEAAIELALRLEEAAGAAPRMDAWEAWLAAVEEQAAVRRTTAKKIASQLRRAAKGDADKVEVPLYGEVAIHRWPEVHMARDDDSEPGDDAICMRADSVFEVVRSHDIDLEWPPSMQMAVAPKSSPVRWLIAVALVAALLFWLAR